jgi:hypothetical protein
VLSIENYWGKNDPVFSPSQFGEEKDPIIGRMKLSEDLLSVRTESTENSNGVMWRSLISARP